MTNILNLKKTLVLLFLTFSLVFSLFACDSESIDTGAPTVSGTDSDSDKAEPLLIVMATDKTEYSIDDVIRLTFIANDEAAELNYSHNFSVEYWDADTSEWKDCKKEYIITEEALFCVGKGTYEFKLSERIDSGYPKYRVKQRFNSDRFFADKTTACVIYSNEFTATAEG